MSLSLSLPLRMMLYVPFCSMFPLKDINLLLYVYENVKMFPCVYSYSLLNADTLTDNCKARIFFPLKRSENILPLLMKEEQHTLLHTHRAFHFLT